MRSVPEWIGATDDAKVPTTVRLRIFAAHGGRCHLSGRRIMPGDAWDLDHVTALWKGGKHVESNLAPALRDKHREKSAAENSEQAKADRTRAKHLGLGKSGRPLKRPAGQRFDWSRGRYVKEGA